MHGECGELGAAAGHLLSGSGKQSGDLAQFCAGMSDRRSDRIPSLGGVTGGRRRRGLGIAAAATDKL